VIGTEVSISYNSGSGHATYSWDQFENLLWSNSATDWERKASFTWYVLNYYFYEVRFVAETFMLIEENDTVFPAHSVTVNGDKYPPSTGTVGSLVFSCTSGDGGPGSDFSQVFENYWVDDPEDDIDKLYEGTVNYVGFLENTDQVRDVITSIGFVPNGVTEPGGIFYDGAGLTIHDTEETTPGNFVETGWYNITGRYTIMFYEQ
jgi:hypothetical protein